MNHIMNCRIPCVSKAFFLKKKKNTKTKVELQILNLNRLYTDTIWFSSSILGFWKPLSGVTIVALAWCNKLLPCRQTYQWQGHLNQIYGLFGAKPQFLYAQWAYALMVVYFQALYDSNSVCIYKLLSHQYKVKMLMLLMKSVSECPGFCFKMVWYSTMVFFFFFLFLFLVLVLVHCRGNEQKLKKKKS